MFECFYSNFVKLFYDVFLIIVTSSFPGKTTSTEVAAGVVIGLIMRAGPLLKYNQMIKVVF